MNRLNEALTKAAASNARFEEVPIPPIDLELMTAAGEDDLALIHDLLSRGADPMRICGFPTETALFRAVQCQSFAAIEALLPLSDVNAIVGGDSTCLLYAVRRGGFAISKLLIEHGADAKIADMFGSTCLHEAIFHEETELARLLAPHSDGLAAIENDKATALIVACNVKGHSKALALAQAVAPISNANQVDDRKRNALMIAISSGHAEVARLLAPMTDLSMLDDNGRSALDYAKESPKTLAVIEERLRLLAEVEALNQCSLPAAPRPKLGL